MAGYELQGEQMVQHGHQAEGPPAEAPAQQTDAMRHEKKLQRLRAAYTDGFLEINEEAVASSMLRMMINSSDQWLLVHDKPCLRRISRMVF
ncbi:MAG: hypothetical protein ACKO6N_27060 [Myxococcota bacterium]